MRLARERAGHAFDPLVAGCLVDGGAEMLALDDRASAWDEVLAREPGPSLRLEGEAIGRGLAAMGRFADLISPYPQRPLGGRRRARRRRRTALPDRRRRAMIAIRRAGLVHDLGRVAVHAADLAEARRR